MEETWSAERLAIEALDRILRDRFLHKAEKVAALRRVIQRAADMALIVNERAP